MDNLSRIRTQAVGVKLEQELLDLFSVGKEEELEIPIRSGYAHIFAYYPTEEKTTYAVFINLHGGGFVKGHRDQDVVFCRNICQNTGAIVYDIDYKTAPEKKYPYALYEAYDVIKYLWEHAGELHLNRDKFIVAGHSAGGNLTLGCGILAGRHKEFKLAGIFCDYPPVDLVKDPGEKRYANSPNVRPPIADVRMYNDWYIDKERRKESTASPAYATDQELALLPPTLLITAELDVLGEEAEQLAYRLIEAGVTVLAKRFMGAEHGFVVRRRPGFQQAEALIFSFLKEVWGN